MLLHELHHFFEGNGSFEPHLQDKGEGIVTAGSNTGIGDLDAQFLLFLLQCSADLGGIHQRDADLTVGISIVAHAEFMHQKLYYQDQCRDDQCHPIHTGAAGQAYTGGGPDAGGSSQTLYGIPVFKDNART